MRPSVSRTKILSMPEAAVLLTLNTDSACLAHQCKTAVMSEYFLSNLALGGFTD